MRPELSTVVVALLLSACPPAKVDPPPPPVVMEQPDAGGLARSVTGNLRFKGPERLNADFAAALELQPADVCKELGQYACVGVHNLAMGGVDPYGPGVYEPSPVTAVTTPLVVERLAWGACAQRVDKDLVAPSSAVVFRGLPMTGPRLTKPDGAEVVAIIGEMTRRGLLREPYENEVTRYVQLAKDLDGSGTAEPARAWMVSLCFAVLSSSESVFY